MDGGDRHNSSSPLDLVVDCNSRDEFSESSETSVSTKSGARPKPRNPKCARCLNHDQKRPVKNHKRFCPYKECECENCVLLLKRQRVMAAQVRLRRMQAQDEALGRSRSPSRRDSSEKESSGSAASSDVSPVLAPVPALPKPITFRNLTNGTFNEPPPNVLTRPTVLVSCNSSAGKFDLRRQDVEKFADEVAPMNFTEQHLIYAILKECNFNKDEAMAKIGRALGDYCKMGFGRSPFPFDPHAATLASSFYRNNAPYYPNMPGDLIDYSCHPYHRRN